MRLKALLRKDLAIEWRNHENLLTGLLFALLLTVIGALCFDAAEAMRSRILPGLFWMIYTFAASFMLGGSLQHDETTGMRRATLLAGVTPELYFAAKCIFNWLLLTVVGVMLIPFISIFYNYPLADKLGWMLLLVGLTGIGFTLLGTFCASILRSQRGRAVLLPLIFYPLALPLVLSAIQCTGSMLDNSLTWQHAGLRLLAVCDLIYGAAGFMLIEHLLEER